MHVEPQHTEGAQQGPITAQHGPITLHLVPSTKFKTTTIGIYIERPLTTEEASLNALALRLMVRATATSSPMQLNQRLQDLYGAYLQADTYKYGNLQSLQLKLTLVGDKHLPEPIFFQGLSLMYQLLHAPITQFSGFDQLLALEKKNLTQAITSRKSDKTAYAHDLMLETLFPSTPYAISPYGEIDIIEALTPLAVKNHIEQIISKAAHNLVIMGEIDMNTIEGQVASLLGHIEVLPQIQVQFDSEVPSFSHFKLSPEMLNPNRDPLYTKTDSIGQAKINICYTMDLGKDVRQYYSAMLLNHILGGGASSILFEDLRERQSLCYYIHARADKFMGIVTVMCGTSIKQMEHVLNEVEGHFEGISSALLPQERVARSKKMLIGSYHGIADSPASFMNFVHSQRLVGLPEALEDIERILGAITAEDLLVAAKKMSKLSVFALVPEDGEVDHD